jgi:hypothetical protein
MVNSHKINVVLITFHTTMSKTFTKEQFSKLIAEIARSSTRSSTPTTWTQFIERLNLATGVILEGIHLNEKLLKRLKVILAEESVGVSFLLGGVMVFPSNFERLLPGITETFVKAISGSAEHAPPRTSGGGGGAAARAPPGKQEEFKGHKHENAGKCGGEGAYNASGGCAAAPPILHKRAPPGKRDGYKPPCPYGESCTQFHHPQGCNFGHQETGNEEKVVVHLRPQPSKSTGSGREIYSSICPKVISSSRKPENEDCRYGLNCKRWGTFGECDYLHKEGGRRELPPKDGPHAQMCEVCVYGSKCRSLTPGGKRCEAIHPLNLSTQVIKRSSRGAATVSVAVLCSVYSQTQSCPTKYCPYAHLSEENLKKVPAIEETEPRKVKAIIVDTSNMSLSPEYIAAAHELARGNSHPRMLYAIGTLPAYMKPENQERVNRTWAALGYDVHLPVRGDGGENPLKIDLKIAARIIACLSIGEMGEEIVVCTNDAGQNKGQVSIRDGIRTVLELEGKVCVMCYEHGKDPYEKLRSEYPTSLRVQVTSHADIKEKTEQMKVSSVPEPTFVQAMAGMSFSSDETTTTLVEAMAGMTLTRQSELVKADNTPYEEAMAQLAQLCPRSSPLSTHQGLVGSDGCTVECVLALNEEPNVRVSGPPRRKIITDLDWFRSVPEKRKADVPVADLQGHNGKYIGLSRQPTKTVKESLALLKASNPRLYKALMSKS